MSERIGYFVWLAGQMFTGLFACWMVTVPLGLFLGAALNAPESKVPLRRATRCLIGLTGTGPLILLAIGTAFEAGPKRPLATPPGVSILNGIAVGLALLLLLCALRCGKTPFLALAITLIGLWSITVGWFVAMMSVTGDWL
jgi:hypothetical protein